MTTVTVSMRRRSEEVVEKPSRGLFILRFITWRTRDVLCCIDVFLFGQLILQRHIKSAGALCYLFQCGTDGFSLRAILE